MSAHLAILVGCCLLSSFLTFVGGIRWRDRQWAGVMDSLRKQKNGMTVGKICRTCMPAGTIKAGTFAAACPHGGIVPVKS